MCTRAAPTLRLDIETEWDTDHNSPWESDPIYRFSIQRETSEGWTALQEAGDFPTLAEAANAATKALNAHITCTSTT